MGEKNPKVRSNKPDTVVANKKPKAQLKGPVAASPEVEKRAREIAAEQIAAMRQEFAAIAKDLKKGGGRDGALLYLHKVLFETTEERLPELTDIPLHSTFPLSIMMTKEHVYDEERIKNRIPLSHIWWVIWMKLRRSIDREHFVHGVRLAERQIEAEAAKGGGYAEGYGGEAA